MWVLPLMLWQGSLQRRKTDIMCSKRKLWSTATMQLLTLKLGKTFIVTVYISYRILIICNLINCVEFLCWLCIWIVILYCICICTTMEFLFIKIIKWSVSVSVSVFVSPNFICLCVYLCVCPAFTAYISLTMSRILIKLGENVGTLVRLIVLKFEHSGKYHS